MCCLALSLAPDVSWMPACLSAKMVAHFVTIFAHLILCAVISASHLYIFISVSVLPAKQCLSSQAHGPLISSSLLTCLFSGVPCRGLRGGSCVLQPQPVTRAHRRIHQQQSPSMLVHFHSLLTCVCVILSISVWWYIFLLVDMVTFNLQWPWKAGPWSGHSPKAACLQSPVLCLWALNDLI